MVVLKAIFIILLLLFPLGQITRLEFPNAIAINLTDIAVFITVAIFVYVGKSKINFKKVLTSPIFIFSFVGFLSLLINSANLKASEFAMSFLYLVRWMLYSTLFFVVSGFDTQFKKLIIKLIIAVGGLVVLGGYIQYFLYPNLRNLYYLGWDEHLYRMFSSFLDPNFAGAFFVLYFILVFGLTIGFLKDSKKNYSLFLSLLSLCSLVAILLTYSRSALIMLIVGSTVLLFLKKQKKLIFMILGLAVIFFVIASKNFYIENLNLLRTASSKARLDSYSHAVAIVRDNPVLGVGFNAYRYAQVKHGFIKKDKDALSHSAAGTDNSFLFVLATTGAVGLAVYIFMWISILKSQRDKTISSIIIASTLGIFANALFINSLFYPSIMLWMWVLIGLSSEIKENK